MRRIEGSGRRGSRQQNAEQAPPPGIGLGRLCFFSTVLTLGFVALIFFANSGTGFLMPGPLSSAHASLEQCSTCHSGVGNEKLSWIHGVMGPRAGADDKACLTCHILGGNAGNPHGTSKTVLERSTARLQNVAATTGTLQFANIRKFLFPATSVMADRVACATCHEEHKGGLKGSLTEIANEQCQACHTVQFDSFDGNHPTFESYPFKRRTRVAYNHASHFSKHFPEVLSKNDPSKRIPTTCSNCHSNGDNRDHMSLTSFDQTCASCHFDQIVSKERATGPKGIAFLSLPGLDLETIRSKNINIGEWPPLSEAELTPFMKVLLSRTPRGREIVEIAANLDLLDLSSASDAEVQAVAELALRIKDFFYTLVTAKASDVMASFADVAGPPLTPTQLSDLSANLPRDVIINAQEEWLPGLGPEIEARRAASGQEAGQWISATSETKLSGSVPPSAILSDEPAGTIAPSNEAVIREKDLRLAQAIDAFGRPIGGAPEAAPGEAAPDADVADPDPAAGDGPAAPSVQGASQGIDGFGRPIGGEAEAAAPADADPDPAAGEDLTAGQDAASDAVADDPAADGDPVDAPAAAALPTPIESDVDPESWADHGGWYRRDYTIYYRPVGHKDRFIRGWINLSAENAARSGSQASALLFAALTSKEAQGQCTKCHSIDAVRGGARAVNWSPSKLSMKQGRFTHFSHEPHFRSVESRSDEGCLTCHDLNRQAAFEKSYERVDPRGSTGNFTPVDKQLCQSCHNEDVARQDCLLCHKYHVNGAVTPIMSTTVPTQ